MTIRDGIETLQPLCEPAEPAFLVLNGLVEVTLAMQIAFAAIRRAIGRTGTVGQLSWECDCARVML